MTSDYAPRPAKQAAKQPPASARAGNKGKQSSPWSIRGVTREARAKATKAAARRRLTLGEWVTNALIEMANEDLGSGSRRQEAVSGPSGVPATAPTGESVGEAMQMLAERLSANEERDQALISLARRIDAAESSDSALVQMSERLGGMEQRTQALAVLSNRLEASEKREVAMLALMRGLAEQSQRSEDRLSSVTKGLGELAGRLEESAASGGRELAAAFVGSLNPLEGAVRELANRLPEQGAQPPAGAPAPTVAPQLAAPVPTAPPGSPAPLRIESNNIAPPEAPAPGAAPEKPKLAFSFDNLNQAAIANTRSTGAGTNGKNGRGAEKPSAKPEKTANKGPEPEPEQKEKTTVKAARIKRKSDDWAADHLAQADKDVETLERLHPLAHEAPPVTSTPVATPTSPEPSTPPTPQPVVAAPAPQPDNVEDVPTPEDKAPDIPPAAASEDSLPANTAGLQGDTRPAKPRRKGLGLCSAWETNQKATERPYGAFRPQPIR